MKTPDKYQAPKNIVQEKPQEEQTREEKFKNQENTVESLSEFLGEYGFKKLGEDELEGKIESLRVLKDFDEDDEKAIREFGIFVKEDSDLIVFCSSNSSRSTLYFSLYKAENNILKSIDNQTITIKSNLKLVRSNFIKQLILEKQKEALDENTDPEKEREVEDIERSLQGKFILRYGINKHGNKNTDEFSEYQSPERNSQMILVTRDGEAQQIKSHYINDDKYQERNSIIEGEISRFSIHEACHALAIPIANIIFAQINKQVRDLSKDKVGLYDQSFTIFVESLVEAISSMFTDIRANPSSRSFNLSQVLSNAIVKYLANSLNKKEIELIRENIFTLARETSEKHFKQKDSMAEMIEKSNIDSRVKDSPEDTTKESEYEKKSRIKKQIEDVNTTADNVVGFDFASNGMVEFLKDFNMEKISGRLVNDFLGEYKRAKKWEKDGFSEKSIWENNYYKLTNDGETNSSEEKSYTHLIEDEFKIYYNSLNPKQQKHIKNIIDNKELNELSLEFFNNVFEDFNKPEKTSETFKTKDISDELKNMGGIKKLF